MNFDEISSLNNILSVVPDIDDDNHNNLKNSIINNHNNSNNNNNNDRESISNNPSAGQNPLFKTIVKTNSVSNRNNHVSDEKSIWSEEEILSANELRDDYEDSRIKPEYSILYGESINPADIYMNFNEKDASTNSCDLLIIKIILKNTTLKQIQTDSTPTRLLVQTAKYRLFLHLPHTVANQKSQAKWDPKNETLTIKLPIIDRDVIEK